MHVIGGFIIGRDGEVHVASFPIILSDGDNGDKQENS